MPSNQPSYRVGAEKRKVQADYMTEQALAQRVHDSLPGPFQSDNLKKIRDKPDNDNQKKKGGEPAHPANARPGRQGIVEDISVHRQLDQSWPYKAYARNYKRKANGR
jgi:hypothetical protein